MEWSFLVFINVFNGLLLCQPCFPVCGSSVSFSAFVCDIKANTKVDDHFQLTCGYFY